MTYVSVWAVARLFASFVLVLAPFDGPLLNAFAAFRLGVFQDMPDQGSHDENQEDPRSDNDESPRSGNICVRFGTAAGKPAWPCLESMTSICQECPAAVRKSTLWLGWYAEKPACRCLGSKVAYAWGGRLISRPGSKR